MDETAYGLKVAKCNDVACAGADETITTVDDPANWWGAYTSIALGADGFPVISYRDADVSDSQGRQVQEPELLVLMSGLVIGVHAGEGSRMKLGVRIVLVLIAVFLCAHEEAWGAICPVPTLAHPTITSALRDLGCDTVEVGAGTFPENLEIARDAVVQGAGPSDDARGLRAGHRRRQRGAAREPAGRRHRRRASPAASTISSKLVTAAASKRSPASRSCTRQPVALSCRIFSDGFESGGANAWSARVP